MPENHDLQAFGDRIEQLLDGLGAAGPAARERAEELVRLVVDLYGAGLERVLEIASDVGVLEGPLLTRLSGDGLVASLLLVHGLHPDGLAERVEKGLAGVRPFLGPQGGVELVGVDDDGVVRLRVGSGDGCGATSPALAGTLEDAVRSAAPEVTAVVLVGSEASEGSVAAQAVIPVDALTARLRGVVPA